MERLAFDTNIVIRFFKNDPVITNRLTSSPIIYLPIPVIAELLFAARNSSRPEENLKIYNEFIATCNFMSITKETANQYSITRLQLKQKGRPIPENDLWIASLCLEHSLTLVTVDAHFDNIDELDVLKL